MRKASVWLFVALTATVLFTLSSQRQTKAQVPRQPAEIRHAETLTVIGSGPTLGEMLASASERADAYTRAVRSQPQLLLRRVAHLEEIYDPQGKVVLKVTYDLTAGIMPDQLKPRE